MLLWFLVRIFSVLIPPLSLYLFSRVIKCLETNCYTSQIYLLILATFSCYLLDNLTRLISLSRLQYLVYKTESDIQNLFTHHLQTRNKQKRHVAIQSIRNFTEAVRLTLEVLIQPGIDGLISLFYIPIIVLSLDFNAFVIQISYILVYFFTDIYTTEKYRQFKKDQNKMVETYYAKLQDGNDVQEERHRLLHGYHRLSNWFFVEWFSLQNIAVTFYTLVFLYLTVSVLKKEKDFSDIFLICGYLSSTQIFLNSISSVRDRLTDTQVALTRLFKAKSKLAIDFDDLT